MAIIVSIIIPCLNEERHIAKVIASIDAQTFPSNQLEIVIADGISTDNTLGIIHACQQQYPHLAIKLINNPAGNIPSALNLAIHESVGEIIIRIDAHSLPDTHYVELCVEDLQSMDISNVGGLWLIQPGGEGWIARSIAHAASHPFGAGDARYRYSKIPAFVETVPFGAFSRELITKIGYFNESLRANEDYEFNARILRNGGKIYFDPRIKSKYFARSSLSALARQYWNYGFWKLKMMKKFPASLRLRQALPPLFVAGLLILILIGIFNAIFLYSAILLLFFYFMILFIGSAQPSIQAKDFSTLFGIPIAIFVMHISWGSGFIASIFIKNKGYN